MTEIVDPTRLPLWGSRLIEASAGTGKTWTIAALYLRLVLGHGGDAAYRRALLPGEILVMTFTKAATRELSDRIRARLLDAARAFRGETGPAAGGKADALLESLAAGFAPGAERDAAAWRLATAAEAMDDASVHTIDAWCQRMLREHAFDSGCLFDEELAADESAMLAEAARDYWRQQAYPLPAAALEQVLTVWRNVDRLADDARELLRRELPQRAGDGSLGELIERIAADRRAAIDRLRDGWVDRAAEMKDWIVDRLADADCALEKRRFSRAKVDEWLQALADWAAGTSAGDRPEMKTGEARFTPQGIAESCKPGRSVAVPAVFAEFETLMSALSALPTAPAAMRLHAAVGIGRRLAELKSQAGSYGFADMLDRLDRALDPERNGEAAGRLRDRIVAQYPVAMVDEFQDTSPLQLRIFDRLYRIADNDRDTALLLIGDPKQSIYGFRDADIHSYLGARRRTDGRHYVLGTNHRSSVSAVAAVNHLFDRAESRPGEGAFLFRDADADAGDAGPLPFVPVAARGRPETWRVGGEPVPALTIVVDGELTDTNTSRRLFADRCAERIVTLLNDAGAGFDHPDDGWQRLRPADIAVLVRTGREAAAVRAALRRRLVASVYLSDQESVFRSAEAADLLRLLKAVASPLDARLARAALATRTVGLPLAELARLAGDDEAFDERSESLRRLHTTWREHGVLAMLRQALHEMRLPARWLAGPDGAPAADPDGERRLTNVLHLAELLQAASSRLDGEQALVRWLASQIASGVAGSDEQIVRLESDADLVKLVTVHKSKGLEYPLVFVPFACSFRAVDKGTTRQVDAVDGDGRRTLHLSLDDELVAAADRERLREDLRLLYVALTRARHALWVGVSALKSGNSPACVAHRSAFGVLVGGPDARDAGELVAQVRALAHGDAPAGAIVVEDATSPSRTQLQPRAAPPALRDPQVYRAGFDTRWTIASFTSLVRGVPTPPALAAIAVRDDEAVTAAGAADAAGDGAAAAPGGTSAAAIVEPRVDHRDPWHTFPRGALAGNFLHGELEVLAADGFDLAGSDESRSRLLRRCEQQGYGRRADAALQWLTAVTATELPPLRATLAGLDRVLPEMEFWFPSDGLATDRIDALCRAHVLPGRARPPLPERRLHGMLMGFADLAVEHAGRWWVLDYKSNALGAVDADYDDEALASAMLAHRYDVQAALYLLALHRLLRRRLGAGYDPARDLGGAIFFFIRGIAGPAAGCWHLAPPVGLLDALDALLVPVESATGGEGGR